MEIFLIDELEVLKIVIQRLESAGIRYMITGSVATNFYVTPRMTRDIDIVVAVEQTDAVQIFSLFSEDFYVDIDSIKDAIRRRQMFNIIHNEGIIKVDFIIRKNTKYRKVEFDRRSANHGCRKSSKNSWHRYGIYREMGGKT